MLNKLNKLNTPAMIVMIACSVLAGLSGCAEKPAAYSQTGFYFNTVISVTLYYRSQADLLEQCFVMAQQYEDLFSRTVEGSDVYRINHSNGTPVAVSDDTLRLLEKAIEYAELSGGAVDPSIGTVSRLWDFSKNTEKKVPEEAVLTEAVSHVDYRGIVIDRHSQSVTMADPDAEIDLGFVAKGYVADRMKEFLVANQVTSAVINLGGNVVAVGSKPDGAPFNIGIQEPFSAVGTAALTVPLTDRSVVSAGNYERYFIKDDIIYHHILDTATGYPVDNDLLSVTIISPASVDGDALSTLVFVLGLEKGRQLIEGYPDVSAVFITKDWQQITV